jgi:hypothetical protein
MHIGCKSMTRRDLIDIHTSAFAKRFYGTDEKAGSSRPVVVIDGILTLLLLINHHVTILKRCRDVYLHRKELI